MNEPDWSLLPCQPREFFELADSFDRKTLKRAYNKWIRLYKPEKFPDEFQRIRAAFEQLENEMRYGERIVASHLANEYVWHADAPELPADIAKTPIHPSIRELLAQHSPTHVYQLLQKSQDKSPYDFFALAVLSDVVTTDESLFFKWLLTGMQAHPNDPGLFALLRQFLMRELPAEFLRSALITASKVVSNDRFYFLTEKAWLNLLQSVDFSKFKQTLARCESNLQDHRNDSQLVFYAELLKAAIWSADRNWFKQKLGLLNENADRHNRLAYEFELLDLLENYHEQSQHDSFADCSIRKSIHDAIQAYFLLDESQGDAKVIECQHRLAQDARTLLEAFGDNPEKSSTLVILWNLVNEDVAQRNNVRLGIKETQKNYRVFGGLVYRLLKDLEETWHLGTSYVLLHYTFVWTSYILVAVTPFVVLYSWLDQRPVVMTAVLLMFAGIVLNKLYLYPKTIRPVFGKYLQTTIKKRYHQHWRSRFVQLFDATGAGMNQLVPVMYDLLQDDDEFSGAITWIGQFVHEDMGLLIYSLAAPYRR